MFSVCRIYPMMIDHRIWSRCRFATGYRDRDYSRLINSELYRNSLCRYLASADRGIIIRRMYLSFGGQNDPRFIVTFSRKEERDALAPLNGKAAHISVSLREIWLMNLVAHEATLTRWNIFIIKILYIRSLKSEEDRVLPRARSH